MGFGGLYISISGINANKKSLDTVAHNIANVDNPNYVRQSVIHAESRYSINAVQGYRTGVGVDIQELRQIRDEFLDGKLRGEKSIYGYYNAKSDILGEIEMIFNEITNGGLQKVIDDFWDGWSELYKEPNSLTIRGILHERALAFTTTANHTSNQLDNLQFNLNKEITKRTDEINSLINEIAKYNDKIKHIEGQSTKISANDFRDDRNKALDRLSELIPINYHENGFGEIIVSLNGRGLVNGGYVNPIGIRLNEKGHGEAYWPDTGEKINLKGLGELGGLIDARDGVVVEYRNRLNILIDIIAGEINKLHIDGKGLDWKEGDTGIPFFIIKDPNDPAATISLNPLLEDFNKIAAGKTEAKGDGDIAKQILALREELIYGYYNPEYSSNGIVGGSHRFIEGKSNLLNIEGFYRELILSLSLEKEQAQDMALNQMLLIEEIKGRRQEASSVSLDEEMTNMLKYQHSYIANSRMINAMDEMIEIIVNRLGVVGR